MLMRKTWVRRVIEKDRWGNRTYHDYNYTGWFLFGFVPVFVRRDEK